MTLARLNFDQAWAGNVPARWRWSRNKELLSESLAVSPDGTEELLSVSHLTGITPRSEKNVTMTAAESLEGYRLVRPGDLVINTMWAWMGALGVAKQGGIVSPAYGVYSPRASVPFEPRFYDYVYRSEPYVMEMTRLSRGIWSSRLRLYPDVFLGMAITVLPLKEQRVIADYLDHETARIDTLIEEQQRLIEMLRERRASEVAAGFAGPATTPLRQAIEYAQTGPFGTQLTADEYIDGGVPVINPTHIQRGLIAPDDSTTVTPEKAEELVRYRLAIGDIVLGRKGEVDKSALVDQRSAGYVCGSDAMALRPRPGTVPDYLWWFLQSSEAHGQLEFWSVGATVSGLNQTTIRKVRLPLPDVQEQRRVASYLYKKTEKIDTLIAETERFIELARERRAALITAAVTGQIDVREMV